MDRSSAFAQRLIRAVRDRGTPLVVGLDPRADALPAEIVNRRRHQAGRGIEGLAVAYEEFCCRALDVVAPLVPAIKVQSAFFERLGPWGMRALAAVIGKARRLGLLVIYDGKRNDIGSTAEAYAAALLSGPGVEGGAGEPDDGFQLCWNWGADAITVNPYLGADSLEPFLRVAAARGAGLFVLVKTSNPGGSQFQDLQCEGKPLYRHVGEWVEKLAAESRGPVRYGSVGAVVGATYPDQVAELREAMPQALLLLPGFGAQGASAAHVAAAFDADGLGALVASSRGILFAHQRHEYRRFGAAQWERAIEQATRDAIDQLATATSAGRLRPPD